MPMNTPEAIYPPASHANAGVVNMGQPNPFDFSDFGPPKRPSGPDPAARRAGRPSGGAADGQRRLFHRL